MTLCPSNTEKLDTRTNKILVNFRSTSPTDPTVPVPAGGNRVIR